MRAKRSKQIRFIILRPQLRTLHKGECSLGIVGSPTPFRIDSPQWDISFFSAGSIAAFGGSGTSAGDVFPSAFSDCVCTNCGFGVPASIESRASGDTASISKFLFILVDLSD